MAPAVLRDWGPALPKRTGVARLLVLLLLLSCPVWSDVQVFHDVPYSHSPGATETLDLYRPSPSPRVLPLIVVVHGGGWEGGDKSHSGPYMDFVRAGFAVACINYRLAPQWRFPASIEDTKAAVRFLRANAQRYGLDPQRFGAWGSSAGGHLVALLGLAGPSAGWDVGDHLDQSSAVQAVVDWYGPADLVNVSPQDRSYLKAEFTTDPRLLRRASPVTWVRPGVPPFLLIHGDQDQVVSLEQSQGLYRMLRSAGDPATLVVVQHAGHVFKATGGTPQPSIPEVRRMTCDFFLRVLGQP